MKLSGSVHDPETAFRPVADEPVGCKRLCVDSSGYYETFNQLHVRLVDQPIERITQSGVVACGREYALDALVLATGFHAVTGTLMRYCRPGRHGGYALAAAILEGDSSIPLCVRDALAPVVRQLQTPRHRQPPAYANQPNPPRAPQITSCRQQVARLDQGNPIGFKSTSMPLGRAAKRPRSAPRTALRSWSLIAARGLSDLDFAHHMHQRTRGKNENEIGEIQRLLDVVRHEHGGQPRAFDDPARSARIAARAADRARRRVRRAAAVGLAARARASEARRARPSEARPENARDAGRGRAPRTSAARSASGRLGAASRTLSSTLRQGSRRGSWKAIATGLCGARTDALEWRRDRRGSHQRRLAAAGWPNQRAVSPSWTRTKDRR